MTPVDAYLKKRAVHGPWPASGSAPPAGLRNVVVIPALAEYDGLFQTLDDLAANAPGVLAHTAVVCVINNRAPDIAGAGDCADNQRTLAALPAFAHARPELHLAWIDAASPGHELGPKDGVGLARRIGLDWGLARLAEAESPDGALVCLDADTRVGPDYLHAVDTYFHAPGRWAAVIDYAHPVAGPAEACRPILAYELYLRYQELAWHYAGSPYAYPAIGSTMACTGTAYATAGGMNRRQAGEDFYFLQQLAKTGHVDRIRETVVMPSGRASHRVPFGTGRKVGAYPGDPDNAYQTYDPGAFRILKAWIAVAAAHPEASGPALLHRAEEIEPELARYLQDQRFPESWDRIQAQGPSERQRDRQFHQWFDAFRTLKLLHHLRDHGYPRQDLFTALGEAMAWQNLAIPFAMAPELRGDVAKQRALLEILRQWRP